MEDVILEVHVSRKLYHSGKNSSLINTEKSIITHKTLPRSAEKKVQEVTKKVGEKKEEEYQNGCSEWTSISIQCVHWGCIAKNVSA